MEAVRRGLHTRLGSYNNLAPASILVTVTHTITPSHQWWSVSQQHTLSTTVLTMQQYSNTHFSSGTSTVKSHLLGVFLAFSQVFFANYIELGMLKISTFEVTVYTMVAMRQCLNTVLSPTHILTHWLLSHHCPKLHLHSIDVSRQYTTRQQNLAYCVSTLKFPIWAKSVI